MFMRLIRLVLAVTAVVVASGCGNSGSSASPPAGGLTLTPMDGQILVSWNDDPGVEYYLWYGPVSNPEACQSTSSGVPKGCQIITSGVRYPYAATGLINGVSYSFVMNGRHDGGPAGSNTPVASATPSLAGATWQAGTNLGGAAVRGITHGGYTDNTVDASGIRIGYHIAVGDVGTMYKSSDGLNWTAIASPTGGDLNAAIFSQSNFIAAGDSGSIFYSLDTVNWTAAVSGTSQALNALANNAGLAKCFGVLVGTVTSIDYFTTPNTCGFWGSKGNTATITVAVGDAGTILYSTNGGQAWTLATASSIATTQALRGVAYSPATGTMYAVGAGGTIISSKDGNNWSSVASGTTADLNSIAVLATTDAATLATSYTIVAVGSGGTILTSSDGITWTSQTANPAADLYAVTGWSQFVTVGAGGAIFTSVDGTAWTNVSGATTADLYGVLGAAGQYNAVGQGGASIYSR